MPFALLIIGVLLVVSGLRGTSSQLVTLVKADFTGQDNFVYWMTAMLILGALGYIDELKPLSRIFTILVVVVLFLSNGGFFQQFTAALGTVNANSVPSSTGAVSTVSSTTIPVAPVAPTANTGNGVTLGVASGIGDDFPSSAGLVEPSTSELGDLI